MNEHLGRQEYYQAQHSFVLNSKLQLKKISKSLNNINDDLINWVGFVAIVSDGVWTGMEFSIPYIYLQKSLLNISRQLCIKIAKIKIYIRSLEATNSSMFFKISYQTLRSIWIAHGEYKGMDSLFAHPLLPVKLTHPFS